MKIEQRIWAWAAPKAGEVVPDHPPTEFRCEPIELTFLQASIADGWFKSGETEGDSE